MSKWAAWTLLLYPVASLWDCELWTVPSSLLPSPSSPLARAGWQWEIRPTHTSKKKKIYTRARLWWELKNNGLEFWKPLLGWRGFLEKKKVVQGGPLRELCEAASSSSSSSSLGL
jgi:hypothetical protein